MDAVRPRGTATGNRLTVFASMAAAMVLLLGSSGCGTSQGSSQTTAAITSVAVSCSPSSIAPGAGSQCSATVQGTGTYSSAVTWTASAGSITAAGALTAPSAAGSLTVTATSAQNATKSGTATVTVQAAGSTVTSVSVSCSPGAIAPGATTQCTAAVQGTGSFSTAVAWTASSGSISTAGVLTAPSTTGSVTVTATSKQDATVAGSATVTVQNAAPQPHHVVLVMEENQSYSTVVGNTTGWPNLNALIGQGALPTNYYANTHPSIGNYFMLTTGQILTNDDNSTKVWDVDNLARRMLAAGLSFRVYAEGISQGYVGGDTGLYLIRHNPFAMLSDVADSATVANEVIWPFSQFAADAASGNLPQFSFIVPDVDDDAHNGTPQQADTWLESNVVTPLESTAAFSSGGDGVLMVDFDEAATSDTTHGGGHVSPVLWGPIVKAGYHQTSTTLYQHPSTLATIMELLQLANPPGAAATAPLMNEFLNGN